MMRETLILFTRFPVAGRAKTRLIPYLGAEGAARLQREMTEHVLARAWPLVVQRGVKLRVRYEGGSAREMRRWLGSDIVLEPQGNGDLGERMERASIDAFNAGAGSVVIIGADCPQLTAALIRQAFDSLSTHRLVFGPAKDGGYYLVGLKAPLPQVFRRIPWSTSSVLAESCARARELAVEPVLLPRLSDIDQPADLESWHDAQRLSRTISVIIPTLNEAEHLPFALEAVLRRQPAEAIIADGGSSDDTMRIAESSGARLVTSPPGRARQMNAGAAIATGETLLFLHADTILPADWRDSLLAALRQAGFVGGAFRFKIREPLRGRWLVEATTNFRSRFWRLPYGDQGLFVRRWAFEHLGGFPNLPIMEDYEFVRRLRTIGRLAFLGSPAATSGRRWLRLGLVRTTLMNKLIVLGYRCGVPPVTLARWYRNAAASSSEKVQPHPLASQSH